MSNSLSIQSLITFINSQGTSARGTILRISRSRVVFEVYNPYSIVQLSEVLDKFIIRRGERAIYTGRAVVSNLVNTGLMLIVSVNLIDAWSDLSGLLRAGRGIGNEVKRFIEDYNSTSNIQAGYQLAVSSIRNFLSDLGRWLDQVDLDAGIISENPKALSDEIFLEISSPLIPRLTQLFQDFEEEALAVPQEALSYHKAYAQRDLHPLLLRAPFVHRTFSKPLGFAGDFEVVNMMLRNQREGPNTYAQLLHTFGVSARLCQAHRNRIQIIQRLLTKVARNAASGEHVRILNIGCGPAHEIVNFVRDDALSRRCIFELVDFSQEALDATRRILTSAINESHHEPQIDYVKDSVHNLLKNATRQKPNEKAACYDLIYCAGLFDYLSDKVCSRLISLFCNWIKPQGLVVVTNVNTRNEYRGLMEHILDWYLVYRDETQMKNLVATPRDKRVYTDNTGLNVFLEVRIAKSSYD